jgi:hypothetical protein
MKKNRVILGLTLGIALLFVTSQVFASPLNAPEGKGTPPAHTPGANATQNADNKATKQADKPHGKHEHFKGTVTSVDSGSLSLTLRDGSSVTVGLTSDTQMKFPGPKDSAPTSIQNGMTVNVQAIRNQSNNLVALRVLVIPGKPTKIHRVGIVTAYTAGGSITIQDKDGNSYIFTITSETKLLPAERAGILAVGSRVTIIAPRDPAAGGVTVTGIVIHPAAP